MARSVGSLPTSGLDAMSRSMQEDVPIFVHPLHMLCASLWAYNHHEPRYMWNELFRCHWLKSPSSGIFVDVGAACDMVDGEAALGHNFSVLAFETRPRCVQTLQSKYDGALAKAARRGWPSPGALQLLDQAVGNVSNTTLTLHMSADSSSTHLSAVDQPGSQEQRQYRGTTDKPKAPQTLTVGVVRLDEIVRDATEVAVLKMDVQGGEYEAMLGAHALLSRPAGRAPLVVFEYYENLRPDLPKRALLHLMRGYGYQCHCLTTGAMKHADAKRFGLQKSGNGVPRRWAMDFALPPEARLFTDFACIKRSANEYATLAKEAQEQAQQASAVVPVYRLLERYQGGRDSRTSKRGILGWFGRRLAAHDYVADTPQAAVS